MCLRLFGLYCSACLGILFVSILCMCCSHFSWYRFISFTIFSAPVFSLILWFFSLSSFVTPRRCLKNSLFKKNPAVYGTWRNKYPLARPDHWIICQTSLIISKSSHTWYLRKIGLLQLHSTRKLPMLTLPLRYSRYNDASTFHFLTLATCSTYLIRPGWIAIVQTYYNKLLNRSLTL